MRSADIDEQGPHFPVRITRSSRYTCLTANSGQRAFGTAERSVPTAITTSASSVSGQSGTDFGFAGPRDSVRYRTAVVDRSVRRRRLCAACNFVIDSRLHRDQLCRVSPRNVPGPSASGCTPALAPASALRT